MNAAIELGTALGQDRVESVGNGKFSWAMSNQSSEHPAAEEFARSLEGWIATDTILLQNVDAGASGNVDIVLVGRSGTVAIQFDGSAVDRPVPYFVDCLYMLNPLDVVDSEIELIYILMKSSPRLFAQRARRELPGLARMDVFKFATPQQGRLSSFEIRSTARRFTPLVLRVLGTDRRSRQGDDVPSPAAA